MSVNSGLKATKIIGQRGSTASRLQPLQGGSLLFKIQFPEIPGTHFNDLIRMKD